MLGHRTMAYHGSSPAAALLGSPVARRRPRQGIRAGLIVLALAATAALAWALFGQDTQELLPHPGQPSYVRSPVLISYSYYEKDSIQVANFEFFLAAGTRWPEAHRFMHWSFVVNGESCTPCRSLQDQLVEKDVAGLQDAGIKRAMGNYRFTLLMRSDNVGMDLAAHNATLEYFMAQRRLRHYRYFIFLNSSVKGPFAPTYLPDSWHWTHAFLAQFIGKVHAVGSSLVCLPEEDAGGPGPRLESWAFALDREGLAAATAAGAFAVRACKLCTGTQAGIVVGGEYGLTLAQLRAGYNVATLMTRYAKDVDWSDKHHWSCNDRVHPSRVGTYDGISFHPYETIFVKSSWHVADPYTRRYSQWVLQHLVGKPGTEGSFNRDMYRYAISEEAQHPRDLDAAYHPRTGKALH